MNYKKLNKIVKTIFWFGSLEGEDRMMIPFLPDRGTYLDIGCGDPMKMSNTWLLYLTGWEGICIDAINRRLKWNLIRPKDKFINELCTDISKYRDYDLLDIDIDGNDLALLKTMTYYPKFILAECSNLGQEDIPQYLELLGYKIAAQNFTNKFFIRELKYA